MKTTFTHLFFNRSSANGNNLDEYTHTEDGLWSFVKSTTQTLSCSLIYWDASAVPGVESEFYGLLKFDNVMG